MGSLNECCASCCSDKKDTEKEGLWKQKTISTINEITRRESVHRDITIFNKSNKILYVDREAQSTTLVQYKTETATSKSNEVKVDIPPKLSAKVSHSDSQRDLNESQRNLSPQRQRLRDEFEKITPHTEKPIGAANIEGATKLIYFGVEKDEDEKYRDEYAPKYGVYNLPINYDKYVYDGNTIYPVTNSERKPLLKGTYYIIPVDNEDESIRSNKEGKDKPCQVRNNSEGKSQRCMLEKCHKNYCYVQFGSGEYWTMKSGQLFGCDKILGDVDSNEEVMNQHFKILPTEHYSSIKPTYTIKCRDLDYLTVNDGELISEKGNKKSKQLFYLEKVVIES